MSRLIFVNRFFRPDPSATSQILGDLAFDRAEAGFFLRLDQSPLLSVSCAPNRRP
jgi:hypothetical protein